MQNKKEEDLFWEFNNKILKLIALILLKIKIKFNTKAPNLILNLNFVTINFTRLNDFVDTLLKNDELEEDDDNFK